MQSLLSVDTYAVDLDLTTRHGDPSGQTTTVRFGCHPSRAMGTFAGLAGARIHAITLNGSPLDPATAHVDSRIELPGPGRRQRAASWSPTAATATRVRGCTASSTRSTAGSTATSQFEVPDARRVYTTFEQPDLKARFTLHRHRARPLEGGLQRPHPRRRSRSPTARRCGGSPGDQADVDVHHGDRSPGEYHEALGHLRGQARRRSRWATTAASRSVEHLDLDVRCCCFLTRQGFEFFEEEFDHPYPFGEYDQPSSRSTTWARWSSRAV